MRKEPEVESAVGQPDAWNFRLPILLHHAAEDAAVAAEDAVDVAHAGGSIAFGAVVKVAPASVVAEFFVGATLEAVAAFEAGFF